MSAPERSELRDLHPDASRFGVEGAQLPAHASPSYYERPMLKKPHWEWEVISYLFLGGVMGGSGMLVAMCDEDGEDEALARSARYIAFALASICPMILIKHLGRPERFLHMLRIFKAKSTMSMGVWGLIGFSLPATAAAAGQLVRDGALPAAFDVLEAFTPRALTNAGEALFGAFITGYTGVLLSATANPMWSSGKRHIPAMCVCSGIAGACAANNAVLAIFGGNASTSKKLDRLETLAGAAELATLLAFSTGGGPAAATMFTGKHGTNLRTWTMLGGVAVPTVLGLLPFHAKWKTLLSSALTLFGGYTLRNTLVEAGKDSVDDPRLASVQPL